MKLVNVDSIIESPPIGGASAQFDFNEVRLSALSNSFRLGFLASHLGNSMQGIVEACQRGDLDFSPAVAISNNSDAAALIKAQEAGVPAFHISRKTEGGIEAEDRAILRALREHGTDMVILSGYLRPVGPLVLEAFEGRILNIHPSLLPKFGGQGMFGMRVLKEILAAGEKEAGLTIHSVTEAYDAGPILAQCKIPISRGETAGSLCEKVCNEEVEFFLSVLRKIQTLAGRSSKFNSISAEATRQIM